MNPKSTKDGRGNLILSRAVGESIVIEPSDEPVIVTVVKTGVNKTRLAIEASKSANIRRSELQPLTEEPCPA